MPSRYQPPIINGGTRNAPTWSDLESYYLPQQPFVRPPGYSGGYQGSPFAIAQSYANRPLNQPTVPNFSGGGSAYDEIMARLGRRTTSPDGEGSTTGGLADNLTSDSIRNGTGPRIGGQEQAERGDASTYTFGSVPNMGGGREGADPYAWTMTNGLTANPFGSQPVGFPGYSGDVSVGPPVPFDGVSQQQPSVSDNIGSWLNSNAGQIIGTAFGGAGAGLGSMVDMWRATQSPVGTNFTDPNAASREAAINALLYPDTRGQGSGGGGGSGGSFGSSSGGGSGGGNGLTSNAAINFLRNSSH